MSPKDSGLRPELLDGMWEPFRFIAQQERNAQQERQAERIRRQAHRLRLAEINFQIDRARRFIQEHGLAESTSGDK